MRFTTSLAVVLASALAASAQTTHQIMVGANGTLTYSPPNITAALGDIVQFVFMAKNHTVSQSLFASPCDQFTNISIADPAQQNLTSGFMPVAANSTSFPTWSIQITQATPIWFFCAQTNPANHCEAGMVGAINAVETGANTFEAFQAKAKATTAAGTPTNGTTGTTGTSSTVPSGTSSASPSATSGAAMGKLAGLNIPLATGGGLGAALMGVALGLVL